jgi:hypothetical protein
MADYVPSTIVMAGSVITIGILYVMRVPLLFLAIIGIFAIGFVWAKHQDLFAADYRTASLLNLFTSYAPFIIISAVIFIALGYIFFLRGLTKAPRVSFPAPAFIEPTMAAQGPPPFMAIANTMQQATTTISKSINRALNSLTNRNRENLFLALERAV